MKDDVTDYPPAPTGRSRARRERTRDFAWWDEREAAKTVQCPRYPRGCGAPIGAPCRNRAGDELVNQPAHDARTKRARAAEPGADHDTEETP